MAFLFSKLEWKRARYGLAFGDEFLLAARLRSRRRNGSFIETSRRDLPSGLVSVSSMKTNVRGVSRLARLAGEALEAVQCPGGKLAVVLPDLAIRAFVFPKEGKSTSSETLARVASRLPYPSDEALLDTWQGPAGWVLAAVVRRVVLRQYEQALEALGCSAAWVDGASLVCIPKWARDALDEAEGSPAGLRVHVQLYQGHYSLTIFRRADLVDVRVKLRASTDVDRIVTELHRLPSLYSEEECCEISIRGEGAGALFAKLEANGLTGGRIQMGEDGEEEHLRCLLETLLRRVK